MTEPIRLTEEIFKPYLRSTSHVAVRLFSNNSWYIGILQELSLSDPWGFLQITLSPCFKLEVHGPLHLNHIETCILSGDERVIANSKKEAALLSIPHPQVRIDHTTETEGFLEIDSQTSKSFCLLSFRLVDVYPVMCLINKQ